MFRKVLVAGLAATIVLSMTACGSSKKQETVQVQDVQGEELQNAVQENDEEWVEDEETEDFVEEETGEEPIVICELYLSYLLGELSEEEVGEELEILGVSLEEAATIYEESAEDLGFSEEEANLAQTVKHFEAMDEIKNASMRQFKFQVADMILGMFTGVSDCMEQIESSELSFTYEYNPDKLMTFRDGYFIDIYLGDEVYMTLKVKNLPRSPLEQVTRPLKECIVYDIELNDYSNVYYAGGIPAMGNEISYQEYDELMQEEFADIMDEITRSESSQGNNFYVSYSFKLNSHYVLEYYGATKDCYDFVYQACFDETGANLETFKLLHSSEFAGNIGGIQDDDIIIER